MEKRIISYRRSNISSVLLTILFLISCYTIYSEAIGRAPFQILNIVIIGLIFIGDPCLSKRITIKRNEATFLIVYIISCILLFAFGDYRYIGFISACMVPIILFTLLISSSKDDKYLLCIMETYCKIVQIICIVSLLLYFAGDIMGIIHSTGIVSKKIVSWRNADYNSYFGIYFSGQNTVFLNIYLMRNIGIFVEAPIYSYIIVTALYIELFMKEKQNRRAIVILFLTIVTTFSSSALAVGSILIFLYIYKTYMQKNNLKLLFPIVLIIAMYIVFIILADKISASSASGTVHIDDFVACLKSFADHPFLGIGYNSMRALDQYRSAYRQTGTAGMSAGIPFVLSSGGITYGWLYILPVIIGMMKFIQKKLDVQKLGFIVVQFFLLNVIIVEYTLLAQFMLVVCWHFVLNNESKRICL